MTQNPTYTDNRTLPQMLLASPEESIEAAQIDSAFGWENRRLYPALWLLANTALVDHYENYTTEDYPFHYCWQTGESRRQLRDMFEH